MGGVRPPSARCPDGRKGSDRYVPRGRLSVAAPRWNWRNRTGPAGFQRESFPPHDHCNAEASQRSLVFDRSLVDVVRRWQRVIDMTCQPLFVRGQGRKIPLQAVQFPGCAGRRRGLGETRILGCAHSILSCPGHAIRLSLPERATQVRSVRRMGEKTGKCAQRGSRPPVAALPTMART